MEYHFYIAKVNKKFKALSGTYITVKHDTIYPCNKEIVYYPIFNKKTNQQEFYPLCTINSFNCEEYFWGYNPENPQEEIKRQKLYKIIDSQAPKGTFKELSEGKNGWLAYGYFEEFIDGSCMWKWKDSVKNSSIKQLEYLLDCLTNDKNCCILFNKT